LQDIILVASSSIDRIEVSFVFIFIKLVSHSIVIQLSLARCARVIRWSFDCHSVVRNVLTNE